MIKRFRSVVSIIICICLMSFAADIFLTPVTVQAATLRYTVLVLDISGSQRFLSGNKEIYKADTAIEHVKDASKKFLSDVLEASGSNYVAVVTYNSSATVVSDFTQDIGSLKSKVDALAARGDNRSIAEGLAEADALIAGIADEGAIKNVVLFTTGMTDIGDYNYSGRYGSNTIGSDWYNNRTEIKLYAYSNTAIEKAEHLKTIATLYTIGLFNEFEGMPQRGQNVVAFFKLLTRDLATSPENFYEVLDVENLKIVFGEVAEEITKGIFTFTYPGVNGQRTAECYYDDDFFNHSSALYDHDLATMSLCLAMAAFGDKTKAYGPEKAQNCVEFLETMGFKDVIPYGHDKEPTENSIAVVFAHKTITNDDGEYELIVVAVRGGEYRREWAGDFRIADKGNTGQQVHRGFEIAREMISDTYFPDYVRIVKAGDATVFDGPAKLWLTGYSRGAAVANLVASHIQSSAVSNVFTTKNGDRINIRRENLFAYCFAVQNNTSKDNKDDPDFRNIFNIMNQNDAVTRVAPYQWGYDKYGTRLWLDNPTGPNRSGAKYSMMEPEAIAEFCNISGLEESDYVIDKFVYHQGDLKVVMELTPFALYDIGEHPHFTKTLSHFLDANNTDGCSLTDLLFCTLVKDKNEFVDKIQEKVVQEIVNEYDKADAGKKDDPDAMGILAAVLAKEGDANAAGSGSETKDAIVSVVTADGGMVRIDPNDFKSGERSPGTSAESQEQVERNLKAIRQAHEPELYLAWMLTLPDDYFSEAIQHDKPDYRIIRINCPVDIEVYDESGVLLGIIRDEVPQELQASGITVGIDNNDQKTVYLPADENYSIRITATDDGEMSIQINEYSRDESGYTRTVNYYDIPLKKGDTFEAEASIADISGAQTPYIMKRTNGANAGEIIQPSEDMVGAIQSYNVSLKTEGEGAVSGNGKHVQGSYAKLTASPAENFVFDGWYNATQKISGEPEYRFRVHNDIELTAKFTQSRVEDTNFGGTGTNLTAVIVVIFILAVGIVVLICMDSSKKKVAAAASAAASSSVGHAQRFAAPIDAGPGHAGVIPVVIPVSHGSARIITGPMAGAEFIIRDGETLLVGRDEKSAQIRLNNRYDKTSRLHCSISYSAAMNQYTVTDLSRNGTYHENKTRFEKGAPVSVRPDSVILLGNEKCSIRLTNEII